eukprot:Protomagalhaensia_wolfi_Nauph_80__3526@NODE_3577_length_763_cov_38_629834_g2676_i1_p1_GENE_NODE_3577_length_763_cov_38_629834_g2676_i1NODE_3577_length_763_cov_38_629834_g2676_i1_p1_ORF_typecomplete_len127_score16_70EamA/PF00892_20/1_3e07TPT/PF03151_16/0_0032SLC35F/PF06027_12/0_0059_NODE_3577_length_763_cov_38_629834_g2676_i124383
MAKKIDMDLIDFCKGGIWGALGATFNKLAFQAEGSFNGWIPRLLCLLGGIFCSARMISCFASLLQQCTATQATLAQFASNVIATGILGHLIFNDQITIRWIIGSGLLMTGLFLISNKKQ